jgi:Carboxypeptidase regulatory-like domain/TonB dependent receptor
MSFAKNCTEFSTKLFNGALISRIAVALLFLAIAAVSANAQVQNGIFTGTVMDPQGAAVAGADVAITNIGTNETITLKTSAEGLYRVPELPVGTYKFTVTAPGFKKAVKSGLYLGAGTLERVDFKLELGQQTETVMVEAGAVQVQTEDSRLSTTIGAAQVSNLPLNGRNVFDLITLVPGAVDATGVSFENGHNTVINGLRPNFSGFLVNGSSDKGLSGGVVTVPNADIVQEFQELTLNMSAQYGNSAAAIVNVVTKSGTNALHGSAYEFLRNDKLDANPFFFNAGGVARQPLHFNQFGGTLTGPIWKDHLFFTASYQGERFKTVQPAVPIDTESADWRAAVIAANPNSVAAKVYHDFPTLNPGTNFINAGTYVNNNYGGKDFYGTALNSFAFLLCPDNYPTGFTQLATGFQNMFGVQAGDDFTKATFITVVDPGTGKKVQKAAPCSSTPALKAGSITRTTALLAHNVLVFGSQTLGNLFDGNEWSTRIDWVKGQNDRVFGEYYWQHSFDTFGGLNASSGIHGFKNPTGTHTPNFQASWVHTFSPTLINEAKAGYVLNRSDISVAVPGVPSVAFDNGTAGFGSYSGYPQYFHENIYTYGDMMSLQKGKHSLKFGGDIRRNLENSEFDIARPSYYFFDQLYFAQDAPYSMSAGTDPGFVSSKPAQLADNFRHWRNLEIGAYFQDDWKVSKRLTLNLGIRYDLFTRHTEKDGKVTTFIPGPGCLTQSNGFCADAISNANVPAGSAGCTTPFQISHVVLAGVCGPGGFAIANNLGAGNHKNFGPRAGFAYDVRGDGKTAIRGGFGVSYEGTLYNPLSNSRWNPPFYSFNNQNNALSGVSNPAPVVYGPTAANPDGTANCNYVTTACVPSGAPVIYTGPPANPGIGTGAQGTGNIQGYASGAPNTAILTGIVFPSGIRDPYVLNSYFGIQREILPRTVLEVNYVGTLARHLFRAEQGNRLPGIHLPLGTTVVDTFGRTLTGLGQSKLNTNYGNLRIWDNVSKSWYNGLQASVRHQASRGLVFNANYTWSHSIDTGSDWHSGATSANGAAAGDGYSLDPTRPGLDRGNSTFDIRHRLSVNWVYEFPWMKAQKGLMGHILGGWQYNGLVAWQTGAHWTPYCASGNACDFNQDGTRNDRPDIGPGGKTFSPTKQDWANGWFPNSSFGCAWSAGGAVKGSPGTCSDGTTAFFATPCLACDGSLGRNTFVGPSLVNTDDSLFKNFKLTERFNLQFRTEVFNLFNHTNFQLPSSATGGNNANRITSGNFGQANKTFDPREIQFGLKVLW